MFEQREFSTIEQLDLNAIITEIYQWNYDNFPTVRLCFENKINNKSFY